MCTHFLEVCKDSTRENQVQRPQADSSWTSAPIATLRNKQIVIVALNYSSFYGFGAGEKNAHIPASNKTVCVGSVLLPSVIFEDSHLYRRCFPGSEQGLSSASLCCYCCTCNYELGSQLALSANTSRCSLAHVTRQAAENGTLDPKNNQLHTKRDDKCVSVSANLAISPITVRARRIRLWLFSLICHIADSICQGTQFSNFCLVPV